MQYRGSILIADDDSISCKIAAVAVKKLGYNATCVANGNQALMTLREEEFDLLLIDWLMPVMGGAEAVMEIRSGNAGDHHSGIPIIVMTADVVNCKEKNCADLGVNGYLRDRKSVV